VELARAYDEKGIKEELKRIVTEFLSNNDWHEMEVEAVAIVGP